MIKEGIRRMKSVYKVCLNVGYNMRLVEFRIQFHDRSHGGSMKKVISCSSANLF